MFTTSSHNAVGDTDTAALKNMVAASGAMKQLMAYVLVEGGVARLYTFLSPPSTANSLPSRGS